MPHPVGAIVLAAGLGTRMKSAQAKVLHRLGGRPLIAYPLAGLRSIGVDPIVVIVGHQADAVREACAPYNVRFAVQTQQKGTGHAAQMARAALRDFSGDLLLIYGDLPFLRAQSFRGLIAAHQRTRAAVSLLTEIVDDPSGFGRIARNGQGRVVGIVEDRDCSPVQRAIHEVNVGVYCVDADFLFHALERLKPTNAQGELYLTDIVGLAQAQNARIGDAPATAGEGAQISTRADLAAREKTLRDEINAKWMAAGVTLEDPATTYIDPDVQIGRDTVIGPNVILRGTTRIGQQCRFDGTAVITDATIADKVHVKFGVVMTEARLDDEVQVGPFAQLRPGTRLAKRVHIGDFVETKSAVIGAGTKAMHHAYLGDTEIGTDTNIGAGTITCNYDGFRKHRTVIGDRVQIGSDSQLVAPVTVGDDAYVATGTTVRNDVRAGALVFTSKTERQRPGWVAARRASEAKRQRRATPPAKGRAKASPKKASLKKAPPRKASPKKVSPKKGRPKPRATPARKRTTRAPSKRVRTRKTRRR
jgi:bifunctional UDP-N-acetylglucosamine pyrophosphorylase/glucosamine-1-phosphate N-acetyltransferase